MNELWRKLDNTAKIFSLEERKNNNTFRLSVILKEKVDLQTLKLAIKQTMKIYPSYKVKIRSGLFWNYLDFNLKDPIIEKENQTPCKSINFRENNGYLFKVTYFNNKINLDIFHVLTDGVGASIFFKEIVYNYLKLKYNLKEIAQENFENVIFKQDEYLKNADKTLICKEKSKKAFLIKEKSNFSNNKTYHYIIELDKLKNICNKFHVSITEYLTAIYIYALYKSVYDKSSNKDIVLTIPIDLRQHYQVQSISNFFTCMDIEGNIVDKKVTFNKILKQVRREFKSKLTFTNIESYLARDVRLGTNVVLRLIPLVVKKMFIKYFGKLVSRNATSTLSNIGAIKIDNQYKKYIDNIMVLVSAGKIQKVKCTICSYENNLTVTVNSNLISTKFENEFYNLLKKYIGNVRLESNVM